MQLSGGSSPELRLSVVPTRRRYLSIRMRLSGTFLWLLSLQLFFSLALVDQATARKSSVGRRKNGSKTKSKVGQAGKPFDLQACISGAGNMPALRYVAPVDSHGDVSRPTTGSLPFFPSMLGAAEDVSQQQFLMTYWSHKACLVRGDPTETQARFSLTMGDVQTIIRDNPRAMVAGTGFKFASNGSILGKQIKGQVVDVNTALDGYSQGATVVINDIANLWPSLTAHKNQMEDELRIPMSANLYLTPEGERGFNPHYDMDDTFILQLEGVKEWVVWDAGGWPGEDDSTTISPLRDQRDHIHDTPPDTVPRRHFLMYPGDVLYIPRGVTHVAATTADAPSLHVTFAVHALCWEHFMRFLFAPGGPKDPTRAPFQLDHHAWAVSANNALLDMPPLISTKASLAPSLRARFVRCKTSKSGGRADISIGMALQWWLHDLALVEPALRSTFSWYWTLDGSSENAAATLGKRTFVDLLALVRSRTEQLVSHRFLDERMKSLGCSTPSDDDLLQISTTANDVLAVAQEDTDKYAAAGVFYCLSS